MLAALGVVGSLVFVGWELRQSTLQARAAAYQEIGIATAEVHLQFDEWLSRLEAAQFTDPDAMAEWTPADWNKTWHHWLGVLRIWETLQLQVDQGLLPPNSLETLGWENTPNTLWSSAAFVCLWPSLRQNTSAALVSVLEGAAPPQPRTCDHQVSGVPGMS